MMVRNKISFQELLGLLQIAKVVRSNLDSLPCRFRFINRFRYYRLPTQIQNLPFEQFIKIVKYSDNERTALLFVSAVTGITPERLGKLPARIMYPIWTNYLQQVERLLKSFKDVNDEMPTAKRVSKTMEEFGLLNIVFFISGEDTGSYSKILEQPVSWVYVHYRHRAFNYINQIAQAKNDKNTF